VRGVSSSSFHQKLGVDQENVSVWILPLHAWNICTIQFHLNYTWKNTSTKGEKLSVKNKHIFSSELKIYTVLTSDSKWCYKLQYGKVWKRYNTHYTSKCYWYVRCTVSTTTWWYKTCTILSQGKQWYVYCNVSTTT